MHCQNCGTQLSSGILFCPNCGTAAPKNVSQPTPVDPTLAASPYQPSPVPPTSYGPPPPPSNSPVPDPYAGYNPSGQQTPYGYNPTPASIPPIPNAPNYLQAQPFPTPPVTPPRKSQTGLIIGITAAVLVVVICGLFALGASLMSKSTTSDSTTTTQYSDTPTPYAEDTSTPTPSTTSSSTPSGNPIDPTAASIITDAQTASSINQITTAPINLTDTFQMNTDIYVTFKLNNNAFDFSQNVGYVSAKFYARSTYAFAANPLRFDRVSPGGAFKVYYAVATPATAELYWCLQSDCSDAKLAQVVTFTITN